MAAQEKFQHASTMMIAQPRSRATMPRNGNAEDELIRERAKKCIKKPWILRTNPKYYGGTPIGPWQ
jgi:hypothetical protein